MVDFGGGRGGRVSEIEDVVGGMHGGSMGGGSVGAWYREGLDLDEVLGV